MTEKHLEKTAGKVNELKQVVRGQIIGYFAAALGLVAGLAWNDAVKSLIEYFFPLSQNTIQAKFTYALVLSVLVGLASFALLKWTSKKENN